MGGGGGEEMKRHLTNAHDVAAFVTAERLKSNKISVSILGLGCTQDVGGCWDQAQSCGGKASRGQAARLARLEATFFYVCA